MQKITVWAVLTRNDDINGRFTFVELRTVRQPRMLIPYVGRQVGTFADAMAWALVTTQEGKYLPTLKFAFQYTHWDTLSQQFIYGDIEELKPPCTCKQCTRHREGKHFAYFHILKDTKIQAWDIVDTDPYAYAREKGMQILGDWVSHLGRGVSHRRLIVIPAEVGN